MATVRLPLDEMAHQAVELVIELIEGAAPRSVVIKTAPVLKALRIDCAENEPD